MLLRCLRWGLAGALVAWTLIRALGLERGWPLVPLLAFTPYVAMLALVVAGLALWRRWWTGVAVAGACAAILIALLVPRAVPNRAPEGAPGVRLRVLAANIAANDVTAKQMLDRVRRWDVDVFSAVELPPQAVLAYDRAGIRSLFPHSGAAGAAGVRGHRAVLAAAAAARSRPRAAPSSPWRRPSSTRPAPAPVRIVAVHVPAPTDGDAAAQRRRELRTLPGAGQGPLRLLAGDFNATLDHADLRGLIGRGYHDAAEQAGTGLRPTWPAGRRLVPTLVTIDHVLADRRIRVISARSVAIPGSDHRGVLAELLLPRR